MRLPFILALLAISATAEEWSWNKKENATSETTKEETSTPPNDSTVASFDFNFSGESEEMGLGDMGISEGMGGGSGENVGEGAAVTDNGTEGRSLGSNIGSSDIVDDILESGREGRALEGFGDVYNDPNVQEAIQSGNDTSARSYIQDRLCNLGLSSCDEEAPQRSGVQPQDLIYAQPVHIRPVGRPIPALPIRNPHAIRPYGPPRPMAVSGSRPSYSSYGPPPGPPPPPPPGPYYHGTKVPPPPVYETPTHGDSPYAFENGFKKKGSVVVEPLTAAGLQQHVHHHYHHAGSLGSAASANSGSAALRPVYEAAAVGVTSTGGSSYAPSSSYTPGPVYPPLSQPFYKKELNLKSPIGNSIVGGSQYANRYPAGNYAGAGLSAGGDCFCVPVEQCPAHEILRKEDAASLIDPRNAPGAAGIEALDDVVVTDGNGTIISNHGKRSEDGNPQARDSPAEAKATKSSRRRREAADQGAAADGQARDVGLGLSAAAANPPNENAGIDAEAAASDAQESSGRALDDQDPEGRQYYGAPGGLGLRGQCGPRMVCCRRPGRIGRPQQQLQRGGQCGKRQAQGINGRIKNPTYVDGDSEFGEYPWQVAILKKDPNESVYVCGGTLIDSVHIITAAHCVKSYTGHDLRVRLGEWDVNHDVEFYPHVERDVAVVTVHPEFYAGTLYNDIAILRLVSPIDLIQSPHVSPACLPERHSDFSGSRCWTTGWGKDAFGDHGKYQNVLKEVDVPVMSHQQCQSQLQQTRLGYDFRLHQGFVCAGGEEGKDACKGDGGGPMVCERGGSWFVVGVVSWGVGCGQYGVPGVYVKVAHYIDWIRQVTNRN